jgi:dTDP-4-dehydrorhamnose reductase
VESRIAVLGASGQLGTALIRCLGAQAIPLRHQDIELTDFGSVRSALTDAAPTAVINTAAYNWVDKAEDEPQAAYTSNALGPRNVALVCAELQIPLLHVSTDYVFGQDSRDGNHGGTRPYREVDAPGPVSAYGISKLAGEYFVRSISPQHFVVRTCGLYGNSDTVGKGNFVKTMLRLGKERGTVRVVHDQYCTPTATADLAPAIVQLLQSQQFGLYHLTNSGSTTWCDLARTIFQTAGLAVNVEPITTQDFAAKAQRPAYSVLDCDKAKSLGIELPSWQASVGKYVQELIGGRS